MTHKVRKSSKLAPTLAGSMEARQAQLDIIGEAKYTLEQIENDVKKTLINERQLDLLTVNWKRLNRAHRGW